MIESHYDIKPQFKGNLGMFLVCAELSKRNLIAMPTSRNMQGYDVIVLNPETKLSLPLQVKCGGKNGFPILKAHWRDFEQMIEKKVLSAFVFVDILDPDKPNYFIASEGEMKELLKSSINRVSQQYQLKNTTTWEQMLNKENTENRNPRNWAIELRWIEEYRGKWETITNNL